MPFAIDPVSFVIGFVTATVFWWLAGRARPLWEEARQNMQAQNEAAAAARSSSIEESHRRTTLRRAQGQHLASPLFALDEILQPPLLIAPPTVPMLTEVIPTEDAVAQTLPYLPAWPELAAAYGAVTISLPDALLGGRNIIVMGHPGAGKTVALAHLATLAANRSESLGKLKDHVPFFLHVADIKLPFNESKDVLGPIIDSASEFASVLELGRVPGFVRSSFKSGRALLLLDGFDELAPEGQQNTSAYLKLVLQEYPTISIVTTGSFENLSGLIGMGFAPLALIGWNAHRCDRFARQWGELWSKYVSVEAWAQTGPEQVEPLLLNAWLSTNNNGLSPLEITLKVWGAYAGDSLGPHVLEAIATHIRRLAPSNTPLAALEALAMQVVLNSQPVFDPRGARAWVRSFEPADEAQEEIPEQTEETEQQTTSRRRAKKKIAPSASSGLLGKMAGSGLLVSHQNRRMRFAHPVIGGYLAGRALSAYNASETILNQPDWSGRTLSLRYLAAHGDVSRILQTMLGWSRLPMHRPLLNAARWLRDAPREAPWRGPLMAALAELLQTEGLPMGLRGQAMAAFAVSNDPSAAALFRQFLASLSFELAQLCALGAGLMQDTKAIKYLEGLLAAPSLGARRAACLALVAVGTNDSLEVVAQTLLSADEDLRRAAAEALANHQTEGHAMLKDGATLNDILLRRAVVYGLARVGETWAVDTMQKLQVEDDQWVVRNSATEMLESIANPANRAPRRLTAPSATPWLIEFAGRQGVGISPGSSATDVLMKALKSEVLDERVAAVAYLKLTPSEGIVNQIYQSMYKDDPELREAAYIALWEMGASGIRLPDPAQYGAN